MNRQVTLAARPVGYPKESDFNVVEGPIPKPEAGQVLVKTIYLSVDPYMRGRINAAKSYAANVEIDEVMVGGVIAQVIESRHPNFGSGDIVNANIGWQELWCPPPATDCGKLIQQSHLFQQAQEFSVCRD